MVLQFSDEDKPKCFLCHELQKNYDELRKHQKDKHADFFEFHEKEQRREAAPGDVTIF